jgi:hypothetical protein
MDNTEKAWLIARLSIATNQHFQIWKCRFAAFLFSQHLVARYFMTPSVLSHRLYDML